MSKKIDLDQIHTDFTEWSGHMQRLRLLSGLQAEEMRLHIRELIRQQAGKTLLALHERLQNDLEYCRREVSRRQGIEEMRATPEYQRGGLGNMPSRLAREREEQVHG